MKNFSSGKPGWRSLHLGGVITEPGSSVYYETGGWRIKRPLLDVTRCTNCLLCWIWCPEPAIERREKYVEINYTYCKGCGICAAECPTKAISMAEEV